METAVKKAIQQAVLTEPFARILGIELTLLEAGHSIVEMDYRPEVMDNIYARAHGGAVYGLIDEAFETAAQTEGTIAVALNVNVTYVASPQSGSRLRAEAVQTSRTRKTAGYAIQVTDQDEKVIATCQALAYRTGRPIPFL